MSETTSAGTERRDLIDRDTYNSASGSTYTTDSSGGRGGGLSTSDKIALGVGIPCGVAAIVAIVGTWYKCYYKRKSPKPDNLQANQPSPMFIVPRPAMAEMD